MCVHVCEKGGGTLAEAAEVRIEDNLLLLLVLREEAAIERELISHKVFIGAICKSQFPPKSVNVSFTITYIKDKLTDLCGN